MFGFPAALVGLSTGFEDPYEDPVDLTEQLEYMYAVADASLKQAAKDLGRDIGNEIDKFIKSLPDNQENDDQTMIYKCIDCQLFHDPLEMKCPGCGSISVSMVRCNRTFYDKHIGSYAFAAPPNTTRYIKSGTPHEIQMRDFYGVGGI